MNITDIPTIVITGGPCGGKSTLLTSLKQKLADFGFTVIVVAEAATEFITAGIIPGAISPADFQKQLLLQIIEKEDRYKTAAELMPAEKKVILCDRGTMDAQAYMSDHQFELMIEELEFEVVSLRDKRYDAVIFLRSVAVDKPEVYTLANNGARRESLEEAQELDARTLSAWTGHPHVKVIDNSTNLEGKLRRTLQAICRVLGVPTPLEIERKFLISECDLNKIPHPKQNVHIRQFYLESANPLQTERIRARGQFGMYAYFHTTKEKVSSSVRIEHERQISRSEYVDLLKRHDKRCGMIDKTRYCFMYDNQYFELDFFNRPHGLILLEIELTEETDKIELPDFLKPYATDVTDDPAFSNHMLAQRVA